MNYGRIICITGIDTDIGKTIVTGLLAKYLSDNGHSVITQKICQTGCDGISDDIVQHREIMGMDLSEEDLKGITCPFIFKEPCSPHLAASLEAKRIDPAVISEATHTLAGNYDYVLLEGVGGLMVPLLKDYTLLDYLVEQQYPLILVTNPRLGSINHTLSAMEILHNRGVKLQGLIYNRFDQTSDLITQDSIEVFTHYLKKYSFSDNIAEIFSYDEMENSSEKIDFSVLFRD